MISNARFEQLDIRAEGLDGFRAFHNLLFTGSRSSPEWFNWFFHRVNPVTPRVYVARSDQGIIGSWCVQPKKFARSDGTVMDVGRCFAVGIHPDHRKRGLFVELSRFAIDEERKRGEFEYVLGFPQVGRPVVDAHLKSGWDWVRDIRAVTCANIVRSRPALGASVVDVHDFYDIPLLNHDNSFYDDHVYMNTRWLVHPENRYVALTTTDEGGYVIIKQYGANAHILDVRGNDRSVVTLLNAAKTLAQRHQWCELTAWNGANEVHHDSFTSAGFTTLSEATTTVVLLAARINTKEQLALPDVTHLQMGCEESY